MLEPIFEHWLCTKCPVIRAIVGPLIGPLVRAVGRMVIRPIIGPIVGPIERPIVRSITRVIITPVMRSIILLVAPLVEWPVIRGLTRPFIIKLSVEGSIIRGPAGLASSSWWYNCPRVPTAWWPRLAAEMAALAVGVTRISTAGWPTAKRLWLAFVGRC
jgi:hypothetical protein